MVTFLYATNERMRDRHLRLRRPFAAEIEPIRSTEEEKGQQIANGKLKAGTEEVALKKGWLRFILPLQNGSHQGQFLTLEKLTEGINLD